MFGGRPEVHLVWALGTDLHTDAVLDQKHNLSPTAGGHTGQHTPTSRILVGSANLALCSPPGETGERGFAWRGQGSHRRIYLNHCCLHCVAVSNLGETTSPPLTGGAPLR